MLSLGKSFCRRSVFYTKSEVRLVCVFSVVNLCTLMMRYLFFGVLLCCLGFPLQASDRVEKLPAPQPAKPKPAAFSRAYRDFQNSLKWVSVLPSQVRTGSSTFCRSAAPSFVDFSDPNQDPLANRQRLFPSASSKEELAPAPNQWGFPASVGAHPFQRKEWCYGGFGAGDGLLGG